MDSNIKKVVVVGGGTAGWITAARLAFDHCANKENGLRVTLIESPDVSTIGVGEGSWPTLRTTLREIGVSELEFIRECEVTFKQGSKFVAWRTGNPDDYYYHPFTHPKFDLSMDVNRAWKAHQGQKPFAFAVSAQPQFCEAGLAPKQIQTPEYAAVSNYGYHLNAAKFGKFLQRYCVDSLGVNYIQDHITHVTPDASGAIESLNCRVNGKLTADLYIDCSGAAGLLINKHFKAPFIDKSDVLFNDKALAVQVPYDTPDQKIASSTLSTAQECGWIWDIGLQSRRGVGYTFSSAYTNKECAWKALKKYIQDTTLNVDVEALIPKEVSFRPGYRSTPWVKNCVAVGMSAGFVEPLEASAIVMIEICSKTISNELPATKNSMDIVAKRYNKRFVARWESIVNFLKLHYLLSEREDTAYWRDNKSLKSVPDHLQDLLELWKYQPPSAADFDEILELFGPASYQYILYGMGFIPRERATTSRRDDVEMAINDVKRLDETLKKGLAGLPSNRSLLNTLCRQI